MHNFQKRVAPRRSRRQRKKVTPVVSGLGGGIFKSPQKAHTNVNKNPC